MKRYIFMVINIALLFGATSCRLDDGTTPDRQKANRLLWTQVGDALDTARSHIEVVTCLNDYMLDAEHFDKAYRCTVEKQAEGEYTVNYSYNTISYRINTDGKRLDEGGKWVLYTRYGAYPFVKVATVEGVTGESAKFNFTTDYWEDFNYEYGYGFCADVEYSYDAIERALCLTMNNLSGTITNAQNYNGGSDDFTTTYSSVVPVTFIGTLDSARIDICYKDNILHTERWLTVVVENKFTTFAPYE